MKLNILGYTQENDVLSDEGKEGLKTLSGKEAGICYMSKPFFGSYVSDDVKANKRFTTVADTGHHSISDHATVNVLFEDAPKIIAMILNSLGDYATSEKSGRYTVMTGNSEEEQRLYDKWITIFEERIKELNPMVDDKTCKKLSMENARYLLSVFTPTTFGYSTSIRQFNYIIDWCDNFIELNLSSNYYQTKLTEAIKELKQALLDANLYVGELRDIKHRNFEFLGFEFNNPVCYCEDSYKESYLINYKASFAYLAQAQRHRTLDYVMNFDGNPADFYIPPMLEGTKFEQEWINDISSLSEFVPQGTLIDITETGLITKFLLKCDERLCSRAQLEITRKTIEILKAFEEKDELSDSMKEYLHKYIKDGKIFMKCSRIKCREVCPIGPIKAQTKLY